MPAALYPLPFFASLLAAALTDVGYCQPNTPEYPASAPAEHSHEYPLKSGVSIPLVGMGVGNLAHKDIPRAVRDQLASGVRLIDTARKSNNERMIADAIAEFDALRSQGGEDDDDPDPIHVVTKVWYTHLGYDRTKLSAADSLGELQLPAGSARRIYVHLLLHWPRCNDEISWMHCEEEENELPQRVKDAGPPPHLDKDSAFKESWRALEDIFLERDELMRTGKPFIASIGVSNFSIEDMRRVLENARISPHIYQGDSWLVFHDPDLSGLLADHQIFFQAYSVFGRIWKRRDKTPRAYEILSNITREVTSTIYPENADVLEKRAVITEATVLLAFFVHYDVGVIPRSSSPTHQRENSPAVVASVDLHLTPSHCEQLLRAISALMEGEDLKAVKVSFVNALYTAIQVHWIDPNTKEEMLVSSIIHPGSSEIQNSHPGHRFVAYDPDRLIRREFIVDAKYGEEQIFNVEL